MRFTYSKIAIFFFYVFLSCITNQVLTQELPIIYEESDAPSQLARLGNDILFFTFKDGKNTLWKSDGTIDGKKQVMQFDWYMFSSIIKQFGDVVFLN